MLPKAYLTSHFRMSSSRWVTTPSWLCGSLRTFLCRSSVYCCHLLLLSSVSVRSLLFLSFIMPILAWNVPLISPLFLKRFLVFPILLFSSISFRCSFKKGFFSLLAVFWNSVFLGMSFPFLFLFFPQLFIKPLQMTTCLLTFVFLGGGFGHCLLYSVPNHIHNFQALFLQDLIPWIYLSLHLCNHKGFDLGHPRMT